MKSSASRSSRRSSGASSEGEDGFEQDEDEEQKARGKFSGNKSRSSQAKGNSKALANSGGSATFLTAAEQREQGKKEEKKAAESPYSFLADNIRDVSKLILLVFFSSHQNILLNRKRAVNPTTQITILGLSLSLQKRGRHLLLSKNRFIPSFSLQRHANLE